MYTLHVLNSTNVVYNSAYIEKCLEEKDAHVFIYYGTMADINAKQDIIYCNGSKVLLLFYLIKYIGKAEYIVFSSFTQNIWIQLYLLTIGKSYYDKIIWLIWGGDLYSWRCKRKPVFLASFVNYIRYKSRVKVKYLAIGDMDIPEYERQFGANKACYFKKVLIPRGYNLELIESICGNCKLENPAKGYISIQIGHSATSEIRHFDILSAILKYKDEKIRILIPLVYGQSDYANEVEKYAKQLFGNKVEILRDRLDIKSYIAKLAEVDIAIWDTDRQIGLGNIFMLLAQKKKVFINCESPMYNYFTLNDVTIFDTRLIRSLPFCDFKSLAFDPANGKKLATEIMDEKQIVKNWNELDNAMACKFNERI